MTFDLTPEQLELALHARELAGRIGAAAATALDVGGTLPADVRNVLGDGSLADAFGCGAVQAVAVIEEISAVSAGLGATIGFAAADASHSQSGGVGPDLPGLRGCDTALAALSQASDAAKRRGRLVAAAVAVGVGRAALVHAVAAMKAAGVRPGPDEQAPHWVIADGATEVEAARLLTYRAAQALDNNDGDAGDQVARAKRFAAMAAEQAVNAAIRMEGPGGYVRGGVLERLTRDARTLAVILEG